MFRRIRVSFILSIVVGGVASAYGQESEAWKRLQAMPREQRVHLADNLDRFDALSDEERESIRRFDAQIAALDPALQARYRALLRRYHVWVSGLDDAKREELATVDSLQDKLALVTKWLKAEKQAIAASKSNFMLGIQPGDLGTIPPFEMANALRVWFKLTPSERGPIEAIPAIPRRLEALRRIGEAKGIEMRSFPGNEEAALSRRLEMVAGTKGIFRESLPAIGPLAKKKGQAGLIPSRALAESLYFIEHPPASVSLDNLVRFEAKLPPWFRASLDPLPPEDARRRLTILYRQVYPHPAEVERTIVKPAPNIEPKKTTQPTKSAGSAPSF